MQLHVSLRGRQREIWQTEEGKAVWPWGQNRVMCHEPRNGQPPEAGRGREKILLWSLWRECCPPDALISAQRYRLQTSGLPNCEGINFCFKRPGLWKLFRAATRDWYSELLPEQYTGNFKNSTHKGAPWQLRGTGKTKTVFQSQAKT